MRVDVGSNSARDTKLLFHCRVECRKPLVTYSPLSIIVSKTFLVKIVSIMFYFRFNWKYIRIKKKKHSLDFQNVQTEENQLQ